MSQREERFKDEEEDFETSDEDAETEAGWEAGLEDIEVVAEEDLDELEEEAEELRQEAENLDLAALHDQVLRDENLTYSQEDSLPTELDEAFGNPTVEEQPLGYALVDTDAGEADRFPVTAAEQDLMEEIGTNEDAIMDQIDNYTDDPETLEDFQERQRTGAGSDQLLEDLLQHHSQAPELSGDDLDADWSRADQSGEEAVGGSVPTPDQDQVDELGEAVGITYADDEPLNTADKLGARDEKRWELDPASSDDEDDEEDDEDNWTNEGGRP